MQCEPSAIQIDPDAIYDDASLRLILGVTSATLTRGRRSGALRHTRKGKRLFHLGKWVLDWPSPAARSVAKPPG